MEHAAPNLAERAIAGDGDALAALWAEHRAWVAAVVLAVHGNARHLDDTLQEIALAVARDIGRLGSPGMLRPWLRALARNVAVNAIRRGRRDRAATERLGVTSGGAPSCAARNEGREALDEMMRLVCSLPEEYREPLLLRATREMPVAVIAEIMGLTAPAVETRLRRAREMLREATTGREAKGASA